MVWFPATITPSPFPTAAITPTLDVRPQVSQILVSENFSDASRWDLTKSTAYTIALGKAEISLAIATPKLYIFSLYRRDLPVNFYAEITASPTLCRDADEYGLLLRVSPSLEFYRFSLSCDGRVRVDKYFHNTASSPQPWTYSSSVPPGAPSESRLGVMLHGKEMSFFVNKDFIFKVSDPSLPSGALGVFVRSAGDNAVTVNFSDLQVYKLAP